MLRTRGYLPHLEVPESTYFVTFRLADTLPQNVLRAIEIERNQLFQAAVKRNQKLLAPEHKRLKYLQSRRIQEYLDKGIGDCWLKDKNIAEVVASSINYFEKIRYMSHAWCIMPNHIHWLMTPIPTPEMGQPDCALVKIIHTIKSFSAHQANKTLKRSGAFWNREYYDHCVRTSEEFGRLIIYTLENPVKAGLCKDWRDWPWTKCSEAIKNQLRCN